MKTIKINSTGSEVRTLQTYLHLIPDGKFGRLTEEAVKAFQRQHNLTSDGVVGAATWAALQREYGSSTIPKKTSRKIKEIILHCTATHEGQDFTVAEIRKWHMQGRGWSDIGYHYVIYRDGTINEGRDVSKVGAHTSNHNPYSIGISYVGGLASVGTKAKDTRTPEQKKALLSIVHSLLELYNLKITDVHCHNEYAAKACPSFSIEVFRKEYKETYK